MRPGEKIKCMGGLLFTVFRFTRLLGLGKCAAKCMRYDQHHHQSLDFAVCMLQRVYTCGGLAGLNGAYFKVYYLNQRRRMIHTCTRQCDAMLAVKACKRNEPTKECK